MIRNLGDEGIPRGVEQLIFSNLIDQGYEKRRPQSSNLCRQRIQIFDRG